MKVHKKKKILVNPFALSKDLSQAEKKETVKVNPIISLQCSEERENLIHQDDQVEIIEPVDTCENVNSKEAESQRSDGEIETDSEEEIIFLKEEKSPPKPVTNFSLPGSRYGAPLIDLTEEPKNVQKEPGKNAKHSFQKLFSKIRLKKRTDPYSFCVKRKTIRKKKKKNKNRQLCLTKESGNSKTLPFNVTSSAAIEELSKQLMQLPVFSNLLKKSDEKSIIVSPKKSPPKKSPYKKPGTCSQVPTSPPPGMRVNSFRPKDTVYRAYGHLRPIVIDASNVAFAHGNNKIFSVKGIRICVDFFLQRGHRVIAFLPLFRRNSNPKHELERMEQDKILIYTPSRTIDGYTYTPYDDRFIVQYADENGGVIISRDNFRDLRAENSSWRITIDNRLLMYTFIGDTIMFPFDPMGKRGPNLEEFLRFPSSR